MTSKTEQKLVSGSVVVREGTGALNVMLHPVVIINISDHWTRAKVQSKKPNPRVIGALVGIQTGRNLEIFNSFELPYEVKDGNVIVKTEYLNTKSEQFKKVFKDYEFMGWYSTGASIVPADMEIHKQIQEFNENPLYLQLNTQITSAMRELPIHIYESELRMVEEVPTHLFVKVPYKIETGEAERISVDHIARITPSGGASGSALTSHMTAVHNAITMLNQRIKIVLAYLEAVKAGKVQPDHGLLRRIVSLVNQLPAVDTQQFQQEFINEYNDALMITYLATMTKGANTINDMIDKFNVTYERNRRRGFF
jgi:COP9 signalosome complex subunit 6